MTRKTVLLALAALAILCPLAAEAKITCTPPFSFYGVLDGIAADGPGWIWTVSTWPFLPCEDEDANCVDIKCVGGGDCSAATIGNCFDIMVANCSNDPSVIYIRRWTEADPEYFCAE